MTAILYPIAPNADRALAAPLGRAARESEAAVLAQGPVSFVTEAAGPAFATYEEALEAWASRIDEGGGPAIQPADRYCALREVMADAPAQARKAPKQSKPVFKDGRRWSAPPQLAPTAWRLSVSYWRVMDAAEAKAYRQARQVRREPAGEMDAETLRAIARQPLRPVRPQQPLDIGLFEFRPPDAPHIVMPDE